MDPDKVVVHYRNDYFKYPRYLRNKQTFGGFYFVRKIRMCHMRA